MALVSLLLERITVANLERERLLLDLDTPDQILELRIHEGLLGVRAGLADFDWRPIHASASSMQIDIDDELAQELELAAHHIGFGVGILVAAFASSELCRPMELLDIELQAVRRSRPAYQGRRILRTEPGRGNIYDAYFELPGYQLAFLGLLGGRDVPQSLILEEAFIALANQVCSTNSVAGRPLSPEARSMASRMVTIAEAKSGRASGSSSRRSGAKSAL